MVLVESFKSPSGLGGRTIPFRVYLHTAGLEAFFGNAELLGHPASDYFTDCLYFGDSRPNLTRYAFLIATIWNNALTKVIDLFGYKDIHVWPGNPEVEGWVIRDKIWRRELTTCGDTLMLLGIEEEHRRKTKNLSDYMSRDPKLPNTLGNIQERRIL